MKYVSTRGRAGTPLSFEQVLFSGYAPDGGLFVPELIPQLDQNVLTKWKQIKLSYPEIVKNVVRLFVSENEISDAQLAEAVTKAYKKFSSPEIIPIKRLHRDNRTINIAEIFHGQTKSFKDLALSLVGQFLQHFMEKRNKHVTVLVGTSGDTGSAAIESIRGLSNVSIIVLYPKGMVTEVQELQMRTAATVDNVHLFEVEGTSDDLDLPIEKCFPDPNLTCINSINWARIMIQICHYVYFYVQDDGEGPIQVVIPTGAAGNATAGVYAKLMGLPVKLHVACNENSCVHDLVSNGILEMGKKCIRTPANAMDICNPYNVERLLYLASKSDGQVVAALMTGKGKQDLPANIRATLGSFIESSGTFENAVILDTMKRIWNEFEYIICPHTATGVKLALDNLNCDCYVLATASPLKFPEAIEQAGISCRDSQNSLLASLRLLPLKSAKPMRQGEDWVKILKDEISLVNSK